MRIVFTQDIKRLPVTKPMFTWGSEDTDDVIYDIENASMYWMLLPEHAFSLTPEVSDIFQKHPKVYVLMLTAHQRGDGHLKTRVSIIQIGEHTGLVLPKLETTYRKLPNRNQLQQLYTSLATLT